MNLNHHNYEEFFILYTDNELDAEGRRAVEAFVQQYPDLKEELDLLLQYKLSPDTSVVFSGKEELMKINGETPLTLSNYEEWLVLYVDRELSPPQQKIVENFITDNPEIQRELTLLQRTRLAPEKIVFENKEILYRRAERVSIITWTRVAAAVLLMVAGTAIYFILNRNQSTGTGEVVKMITPVNPVNPGTASKIKPENPGTGNNPIAVTVDPIITVKQEKTLVPVPAAVYTSRNEKTTVTPQRKLITPENTVKNIELPEQSVANNGSNNLPKPLNNPVIINTVNPPGKEMAVENNPGKSGKHDPELSLPVTNKNSDALYTVSQPTNAADPSEMDQPENKKGKLRGFFRKVTRTFEKRTHINAAEDDRLLVAGLAFKLK